MATGHVVEVGGPHHLLALPLAERAVLGVEEDLIGPAPGEHLDQTGGVEPEGGREHGPAGPELLLDALAPHGGLLGSSVQSRATVEPPV